MYVEFIKKEDPHNVLFGWQMPMPPRVGEQISQPGDKPNFVVTEVEYVEYKGYEVGVDCGAICVVEDADGKDTRAKVGPP